jgi:hypothetical protein
VWTSPEQSENAPERTDKSAYIGRAYRVCRPDKAFVVVHQLRCRSVAVEGEYRRRQRDLRHDVHVRRDRYQFRHLHLKSGYHTLGQHGVDIRERGQHPHTSRPGRAVGWASGFLSERLAAHMLVERQIGNALRTPSCRQTSATAVPASAWRRAYAICSSLNLERFTVLPLLGRSA